MCFFLYLCNRFNDLTIQLLGASSKTLMRDLPLKQKAQHYCINNNIFIYPIAMSKSQWNIEVSYRGQKPIVSKEIYTKKTLNNKIWELYEHFYSKR